MSASVNKVILVGHLGKAPELRKTNTGTPVTSFSFATNDSYNDKDGKKQIRTEWHNVEAWGKRAEVIHQYMKKGSPMYIEGTLRTDSWEKDGTNHYMTKVVVKEFQFLNGNSHNNQAPDSSDD